MKSVERLKAEHELIERGLNLLEKAVASLEAGQPLPEGFPQWTPRFFQEFADQCHHAKEEDVSSPSSSSGASLNRAGRLASCCTSMSSAGTAWAECRRRAGPSPSTPARFPKP